MASSPLAWFVTFNPYGLWLPGDLRGWVDRHQARLGIRRMAPNPGLEATARARMCQPSLWLDAPMRDIVSRTVAEVCLHRGWTLHAISVQGSHVHLVCTALAGRCQVIPTLEAWCTRRLREAGLVTQDRIIWAEGGSISPLMTHPSLVRTIRYVDDQLQPRRRA